MNALPSPDAICLGALAWDCIGRAGATMRPGDDVPGQVVRQPGGVAFNVAKTLRRFDFTPALLAVVGADAEGEALIAACREMGFDVRLIQRAPGRTTDRYVAIEAAGGLVAAVADTRTLEATGAALLQPLADGQIAQRDRPWTGVVALDGNLTETLLAELSRDPRLAHCDLRVAAVSPAKAGRLRPFLGHARATIYLNREEAARLCEQAFANAADAAHALLRRGVRRVLVTDGPHDCADAQADGEMLCLQPPAVAVKRVTGAGDTFMAAHIAAEHRGAARGVALKAALEAASRHVSGETDA